MTIAPKTKQLNRAQITAAADAAARQIAPLWPLDSSVAVNPYFGQTNGTLPDAAARLGRIGGGPMTMSRPWFQDRIASGAISDADLVGAMEAASGPAKPANLAALKAAAKQDRPVAQALPTIADLAADLAEAACGSDWPGIIADRIGTWASGYFDQGQALWAAPRGKSAWAAYLAFATHDLTPEIMGLKGFAAFVSDAPDDPASAIARAAQRLGLSEPMLDTYFHQLLLSLNGWSQYARYQLWRAELAQGTDTAIHDLLAIRLLWEEALYLQFHQDIGGNWAAARMSHALPVAASEADVIDGILLEAAERAAQRSLAHTLAIPAVRASEERPAIQAAFCIDVRSEVYRRALEAVDPAIQTIGFAGFFGVSAKHRQFASDIEELRLPVLLNPAVTSCSGSPEDLQDDLAARYRARAKRAWGRFKLAAVSSFAFVEAMGPVYIAKLIRDAMNLNPTPVPSGPLPRFQPELDLETRISSAETVLRAMSLTEDLARLVILAGHGANVVNNAHASGLNCGACGGYSGEVNARLLASLLNNPDVREGLAGRGIALPQDTLFMAALHDTTTDTITLYDSDTSTADHAADIAQAKKWLMMAGKLSRGERALRLPRAANSEDIPIRARNWAEVRPEWALASCQAFIAAPRSRTAGRSLEGRAFLHDYDWQKDGANGFKVLELIMTAPVVVASWISLQYYGSSVAPQTFGAGNKLLHNVVGGIGVLEGNGGVLRAGLPWQSVHDGQKQAHEPLRLSVCIEAPVEAMNDILDRHPQVRALFDNCWLHLFAMGQDGQLAHRYTGNLNWEHFTATADAGDLENAA